VIAGWLLASSLHAGAALAWAPPPAPPERAAGADDDAPWIRRHRPTRRLWELGVFGGVMVIAKPHDFYDVGLGYRRLRRAAPDVGARVAYYPLSFLGIEGEFAGMWTAAKYGGQPAFLYGLRVSGILQLPLFRLVPFAIAGYGLGGIRSPRDALGNDVDPIGHYGVGLKLMASPWVALRLEGRHVLGPAAQQRRVVASHGEVLFGVSVTLGRRRGHRHEHDNGHEHRADDSGDRDGDGDGIRDAQDRCPAVAGAGVDGCAPADADGDGVVDRHDACPSEAGTGVDGCTVAAPPAVPDEVPTGELEAAPPSKLPSGS
jgi:OOP family OmpA-OmpF porin